MPGGLRGFHDKNDEVTLIAIVIKQPHFQKVLLQMLNIYPGIIDTYIPFFAIDSFYSRDDYNVGTPSLVWKVDC
jgi:hypothetical protein